MTQVDDNDEQSEDEIVDDDNSCLDQDDDGYQNDDSRLDDPMEIDSMGTSSNDAATFAENRKRKSFSFPHNESNSPLLKRRCIEDGRRWRAVSPFCLNDTRKPTSGSSIERAVSSYGFWQEEYSETCYIERLDSIETTGAASIDKNISYFDMIIVQPFRQKREMTALFESLHDIYNSLLLVSVCQMITKIKSSENELKLRVWFIGCDQQQSFAEFYHQLGLSKLVLSEESQDNRNSKGKEHIQSYNAPRPSW